MTSLQKITQRMEKSITNTLEEPLNKEFNDFNSFDLVEEHSEGSILPEDIADSSNQATNAAIINNSINTSYKYPASISDSKIYYKYSVYGREIKNGKICPSSGEREKIPYSLFGKSENLGELGSTFRFYLFIKNNSSIMLGIILAPSLLLLYRYQQLFLRYYSKEPRTLGFYWRSLWDYDKNIKDMMNKDGDYELDYILYENTWAISIALFLLLILISRRCRNYLEKVFEEDKHRRRRAEDFSVMINRAHTGVEIEDLRRKILLLIKLFGFPPDYFEIVKMNRGVYMGSLNMILKQISDLRSKLAKLEKQIKITKMKGNREKDYVAALEKVKDQYFSQIQNLQTKREKIQSVEPTGRLKVRQSNSLVFITFATTLQRDIFLSLHKRTLVPEIVLKNRPCLIYPAAPVGNIEWRNIGYDYSSAECHRALAGLIALVVTVLLVALMAPLEYLIKEERVLEIIGPLLTVLISKVINKIREKISLLNRSIYIDMMAYSGISFVVNVKNITTMAGIAGSLVFLLQSNPKKDITEILCTLITNLLAVKIFFIPVLALLKPRDLIAWVRRRGIIYKYRKCPEKVPMLQKDLNRRFERLEAPLVPIFARMVYLSFICLSFITISPLICLLCLVSLQIQSLVDKYLILRRYKKMPEILPFGKKYILMTQVQSIQTYVLFIRWLTWVIVGFGFRWTLIEFIREIALLLLVFRVKFTLAEPKQLALFYFWREMTKYGKFADFVKKVKEVAWGREVGKNDENSTESESPDPEMLKKIKEDLLEKMREERFDEGLEDGGPDELNQYGVKYQTVRKMLEEKILELKEDDYYANCELELHEDYDRANPMTEYVAKQIFLKKKILNIWKENF